MIRDSEGSRASVQLSGSSAREIMHGNYNCTSNETGLSLSKQSRRKGYVLRSLSKPQPRMLCHHLP